jgi:hypothetical protein
MKEEFLHYLWKYSLFDAEKLSDDAGGRIVVLNPGEYNRDSGPDFFNARLIIDGTEWAGNVEIHLRASDFDNHHHNEDPAFDNVILHVVAENDRKVFNTKGKELLTSVLVYDPLLYEKYLSLVNNHATIACEGLADKIDPFCVRHWIGSVAVERLSGKSEYISRILHATANDWEETCYRLIARYFGFRVNTGPLEMLASALPVKVIRKHSDDRFQVEALLFGTAGMLEEGLFREAINDTYYLDLIREFRILSAKYGLKPIHGWLWKFSKLRPANFPSIRISQLAAMLSASEGLFSRVLGAADIDELRALFSVSASRYWDDHFVFGKISREYSKATGLQAADILLINAVIPLLFCYGSYHNSDLIRGKAVSLLEEIDPEENLIIREWKSAGISADSAFITQGLTELRNNYCRKRRCLECGIGNRLINKGEVLRKQDDLMLEP